MGLISGIKKFLTYWYLQWELNTALYMMEPTEKVLIQTVLVFIVSLFLYAAYTYIPAQFVMITSVLRENRSEL